MIEGLREFWLVLVLTWIDVELLYTSFEGLLESSEVEVLRMEVDFLGRPGSGVRSFFGSIFVEFGVEFFF